MDLSVLYKREAKDKGIIVLPGVVLPSGEVIRRRVVFGCPQAQPGLCETTQRLCMFVRPSLWCMDAWGQV